MNSRNTKYSIQEIICKTPKIMKGYSCLSDYYVDNRYKLIFKCRNNHIYETSWSVFLNKKGCQICARFGVTSSKRLYRDKEWLTDKYVNDMLSSKDIGKICEVGHRIILSWLHKFEIDVRSISLSTSIGQYSGNKSIFRITSDKSKKVCLACEKEKSMSSFCKKTKAHDGYSSYCKLCMKNYSLKPVLFKDFHDKISFCEETRKDKEYDKYLQVRCTESNCRKWFTPTYKQVSHRIDALERRVFGDLRFYCSDNCKDSCTIFNRKKYYSNHLTKKNYREVQKDLRLMCLSRDNNECQKCGSRSNLHCHHIEGIYHNPIESADLDLVITLCESCHKLVHKSKECSPYNLRRKDNC